MADPRILHTPAARSALLRGMDQMARLIRPTLGPSARTVMIAHILQGKNPPEILDSGGTIARRTIQIPNPFEDMGAMLVRHAVWRVFDTVGDGSATTAVVLQRLLHEANRHLAAGASAVALRRGIEIGLGLAVEELRRQARPIEQPSEIAGVVAGTVRDPRIAEIIGEVMDSVGPDGAVLVESAYGPKTEHEYIDGIRWNEGYLSPFFVKEGATTVRLIEPRIFCTDYILEKAEQLVPAVEACVQAGQRNLMVVATEVRGEALGLLLVNQQRGVLEGALAVKAPSIGTQRQRILEDIAIATGGRCVREDAGESLAAVTADHLGSARQAWASRSHFGILGGRGRKDAIRQRIAEAKAELRSADQDDKWLVGKIRERIGKLAGAAAVILAGAPAEAEREELKLRIEAAVATARSALEQGVVAGGGAALVACVPALERAADSLDLDEASGVRSLAVALAEPMRAIVANAGLDPSGIVAGARARGLDWTFDVLRKDWVQAWESGIVDPVAVASAALETSASAAATAITADVLVHRKQPPTATRP